MAPRNNYAGIDPHIVAVIARETKKLIGRYGLTASDVPDIEQDLHLKVWSALKDLDKALFEAAVQQIVKHAVIDYLRWRERECRDWRCVAFSLNDKSPEAEDPDEEIGSVIDLAAELAAAFGQPAPWHSRREVEMDLAEGLRRLPGDLRDLATTLEACDGNLSEAARLLGLSRKAARCKLVRLQRELAWLRDL